MISSRSQRAVTAWGCVHTTRGELALWMPELLVHEQRSCCPPPYAKELNVTRRLFNTATVKSTISFIDGDKGILRYRGYPIEQLAEKSNFLEVGKIRHCILWWRCCWFPGLHAGIMMQERACSGVVPKRHCHDAQVAYLLVYGHLPLPKELARWEEAVMRHSAVPVTVVRCWSCYI
jgi:citrate synthase